ncbi:MAG: M15 family metallopeptidase [Ruminococcus sp.]|nr:M15 family metallopeptidase [Ruminococcus sp.]
MAGNKEAILRRKKKRAIRKAMDIISAVLVFALFSFAVGYPLAIGMNNIDPLSGKDIDYSVQQPAVPDNGSVVTDASPAPTESIYESVAVKNDEIYKGELILVNSSYPFQSAADANITPLFEKKTDSYSVSGMHISMQEEAIPYLNSMLDDFYSATAHNDILIVDGYRTLEEQQALYDADLELTGLTTSTLVAKPGHSEHETGYALDFSLFFPDGTSGEYDGTGDYDWIDQHCSDYGYILRYPEDKTELTDIQYESWHYRYVGRPHAYYIMQSGICLEEYISELNEYSVDAPMEIIDSNGAAYEVYFVPADTDSDVTHIPVKPDADYSVSGNNIDGFIVTIDLHETRELVSYTKPVEEVTGITTDEYGNVVTTDSTYITASDTTTTTTVEAVG